jgi:hypothetical protein
MMEVLLELKEKIKEMDLSFHNSMGTYSNHHHHILLQL